MSTLIPEPVSAGQSPSTNGHETKVLNPEVVGDGQLVNSAGTYSLPPEPLSQVSQVSQQQVIPPTGVTARDASPPGEVTGVTGVTPIPDVESERGERLSSQPLTHPSETKDVTPLSGENAPENGLSSHISESKDAQLQTAVALVRDELGGEEVRYGTGEEW